MVTIRRTAWFFALAIVMAGWMGVLGSFRGMAEASMIASHGGAGDLRAAEIAKVQTFLEQKVVMQKLVDYGVSPDEAMAKIRSMSDSELHRLASLTERVAAGTDAVGLLIGVAVLVILVLVILMLMNKRVVVR
ncbi:MAG: hypothetical protein XU12_C0023G0021 [Deltaproteobacteria bacterium CSP1-8]|jgi:hypothetical protein|nr:MAG: hypothetical protein XU12_C0023G0021 [Deltaproteobacteria bacterium CSP1-8]